MGLKLTILIAIVAIVVGNYFLKRETVGEPSPIVDTRYGKLEGVTSTSRDGRTFYEYLGIPYAKPPVGSLRFEVSNDTEIDMRQVLMSKRTS